jgi:nucleotide-binding universal stress UspA family protein
LEKKSGMMQLFHGLLNFSAGEYFARNSGCINIVAFRYAIWEIVDIILKYLLLCRLGCCSLFVLNNRLHLQIKRRRIMDIKKVLVPVDFSENSKKILEEAGYFSGMCQAQLHVVFVVQSFDDYSGFFVPHMPVAKFEEEMVQAAEQKMEKFLEGHKNVEAKVLVGDVSEEIIRHAEESGMDLIIMGTHGYKGLEKVMFGSVAEKVVRSSPCPVLTINPYKNL